MAELQFPEAGEFIYNDLRLKTFPVAVKFLKDKAEFPEKTRQPSVVLGKRIAICQGVTMARNYGWTIGLAKEDVICTPAAIVFGFSDASNPMDSVARLFQEVKFSKDEACAKKETGSMNWFAKGEIEAMVLAPFRRASFSPDTVLIYGNAAQVMRLTQAWSYITGERVAGHFGGKVECDEYLIAPFKTKSPKVVIPGNGERIFAGTQDDELTFALPGAAMNELVKGLKEVGKVIGARYPVPPYQNFQPELPKPHVDLGKEVGVF